MNSPTQSSLSLFLPDYDNGGVERMLVNLASEISQQGIRVHFIVCNTERPYLDSLTKTVNLIQVSKDKELMKKELVQHLHTQQPTVLMTAKELGLSIALAAKKASQAKTKIYLRAVTNISAQLTHRHLLKRIKGFFALQKLRKQYQALDGIIAVSQGIAVDVHQISGIPLEKIKVAHNPVITPLLIEQAQQTVTHPWLLDHSQRVILGIGRLTRQKNFELLIDAFALVQKQHPVKLIILGEGARHQSLQQQAATLGIEQHIDLHGFTDNPYSMMRHAAVFVLSSNWEGSPNVLTEALAVGCPSVATDCPSGPREILQNGQWGHLCPMNDKQALAEAIIDTLNKPISAATLQQAVQQYTVANSAQEYMLALGLTAPCI